MPFLVHARMEPQRAVPRVSTLLKDMQERHTVNPVDISLVRAVDVVHFDTVIEFLLFLVRKVTQTVPYDHDTFVRRVSPGGHSVPMREGGRGKDMVMRTLAATLSVECPHVIIDDPRCLCNDLFVKDVAAKERDLVLGIEWPVE